MPVPGVAARAACHYYGLQCKGSFGHITISGLQSCQDFRSAIDVFAESDNLRPEPILVRDKNNALSVKILNGFSRHNYCCRGCLSLD